MQDSFVAKWVAVMFSAAALTGCSFLIGTGDKQCKSDADCVRANLGSTCVDQICVDTSECRDGGACTSMAAVSAGKCTTDKQCSVAALPRCLNSNCVSNALAEQWLCSADDGTIKSSTVRYGIHIVDFLTRKPPKNIVVSACRSNDVACEDPVAKFTDTDGTGHAQFELPSGFFGFFEVRSSSLPTLLYITKPVFKNTLNRDLPVLTTETIQLTAQITGYEYDTSKGLALLEALDCTDTPQGGIQFSMTGATGNQFYLVDQVPSRDAKVTDYDEVSNSADGGFVNIPPGFVTFNARLGEDGLELGSFNAQIRPNTITFIDMHF
jgi:hypothetical protein